MSVPQIQLLNQLDGFMGSADNSFDQIQLTLIMSKFKIKFTYGQSEEDNFKQVDSVHKGPINLSNIYDTLTNPTYEEITFDDGNSHQVVNKQPVNTTQANPETISYKKKATEKEIDVVPTVDVISKPSSPKRQKLFDSNGSAGQITNNNQVKKTESIKPSLDIEQIRESQFKRKEVVPKKAQQKAQEAPDQIVLKAPRVKFNPEDNKDGNIKAIKKEYVRADKAEKYLYSGIPEKREDDFVGCFGCCAKKPKAYTISNNQ